MERQSLKDRSRNFALAVLFFAATLFSAFHEGYAKLISVYFWIAIFAGFGVVCLLACKVSARRFIALVATIFFIEFFKETMGIQAVMWVYHGRGGQYLFGVCAWVLGGLVAFTLATGIAIRLLRKLKITLPGWANLLVLVLVAAFIPLTLGDYRENAGPLFWGFYLMLLLGGGYAAMRMDFAVFAGIVVAAWLVGNPSEYLGSVTSKVWTFPHNPDYPPLYLVFGCWPLEILAQYALSAFLADEPLDTYTY